MCSKIKQGVLIIVLIAVSLTSCVSNVAGDAFAFKTIKVAKDFRDNLDLTREKPEYLDLDITGVSNICVIDSLFCVMTGNPSGYMHVLNLRTSSSYGAFLRQGRGPGEFLVRPSIYRFSKSEDGRLFVLDSKRIIELDLNASLTEGQTVTKSYKDNLPDMLDYYIVVNDSLAVIKRFNPELDGFTRETLRCGKAKPEKNQTLLNNIVLDTKGDPGKFNLIGSIMSYNHSRDVIVEASLMTNTINLYSLFSDFALSICIGDKPDDIHRLERAVYGTTRDSFIDLKPYNDYFLVLYKREIGHNLVMEFSWDGTPLSRIKVPSYVTKICKDPVNNVLYALEENTERLLKWRL